MSDDRTFSVSQNRQALIEDERRLAALQRRVDARRKMAEAAEELEAAERELSADGTAESPPPAESSASVEQPSPSDPKSTGKRAEMILRSEPTRAWNPHQMHDEMVERRWSEPTKDARAAVRVALTRLHKREPRITRTQDGMTYAYQWVAADGDQLARSSNGHAPTPDWRN
jgi:hypothetical protein